MPSKKETAEKVVVLVQARLGSTRLPKKCLRMVALPGFKAKQPMLAFLLSNLAHANLPIVLAVPARNKQAFAAFLRGLKTSPLPLISSQFLPKVKLFASQCSEQDVLTRFMQAAKKYPADNYVRVTGDNPFTCAESLKSIVKSHNMVGADISFYHGLPYGAGVEVFTRKTLFAMQAAKSSWREHVTKYAHSNSKKFCIHSPLVGRRFRAPHLRFTVDTMDDWNKFSQRITHIFSKKYSGKNIFSLPRLIKAENKI